MGEGRFARVFRHERDAAENPLRRALARVTANLLHMNGTAALSLDKCMGCSSGMAYRRDKQGDTADSHYFELATIIPCFVCGSAGQKV